MTGQHGEGGLSAAYVALVLVSGGCLAAWIHGDGRTFLVLAILAGVAGNVLWVIGMRRGWRKWRAGPR